MSEQNAQSGIQRQKAEGLTPRQAAYVAQRLAGLSQTACADKIGISTRTARIWEKLPAVEQALRAGQDELISEATTTATALLRPALIQLMAVGNDPDAPTSARVSALRSVADLALKLREFHDLVERVAALEGQQDRADGPRQYPS